jgi:hypothetical protein
MARGTTLTRLLDLYRAKARLSLNPAHNSGGFDVQVKHLQATQEWLWSDFDWPHLRVQRMAPAQAGQRCYAPPEDMPIDRIERVEFRVDTVWGELQPGIDAVHYAAFDSDLNQRDWPIRRWQIYEGEQVEVWPICNVDGNPTTLDSYLRFTGIRSLKPLVKPDDRADLDDNLIVLFAAAETLAATGAKDAELKLNQANKLYARMRGALMPRKRFRMFGGASERPRRDPPAITYRPPTTSGS